MTAVSIMLYYLAVHKWLFNLILALSLFQPLSASAQDYRWPLKIRPRLSSQFGDYRSGHWHAGIDITTKGKTGYRVYAVADGYVFRVRTSFWGYGKALYLKLADGRIAVYGHLERFDPKIEEFVRRRQIDQKKYYQDIFFKPGQFPVKKGQYIALTGQTGSGAPHLHFELRDEYNLPINPLKNGYRLSDSAPPVVEYLVVKRYHEYGPANYHDIEFLKVEGRWPDLHVVDTVAIYGKAVFAVSAYDHDNGFNYGLYGANTSLDGNLLFGFELNRLDYSSGDQIDYVRDHELKKLIEKNNGAAKDSDRNIFYRLYVQPCDRQMFYGRYSYPDGIIDSDSLEPGTHSFSINLSDINGNSCHIQLYLKKAILDAPEIRDIWIETDSLSLYLGALTANVRPQIQARKLPHMPYEDIPSDFDMFEARARLPLVSNYAGWRVRIKDDNFSPWIVFRPAIDTTEVTAYADYLEVVFSNDAGFTFNGQEILLSRDGVFPLGNGFYKALIPLPKQDGLMGLRFGSGADEREYFVFDTAGYAYSPDSIITLDISGGDLLGRTILRITDPILINGQGYSFDILPEELLFKGEVEIRASAKDLDVDIAQASLYYYSSSKDKWYNIGTGAPGNLNGSTIGGGKFAILIDETPPSITRLRPRGSVRSRRPRLSCIIDDDLSGFDKESQLEMSIDGLWVPAHYDIDNKILAYQVRYPLRPGPHILKATAVDRQGNRSSAVSRFTILE